ncbi:MAG: acetate--CoA ligase family protein [Desulfurococcaceae archaeon]
MESSSVTHKRSILKLLEHEAFQLLEKYGIPHPPYGLAKTPEEAVELAEAIGYPVVMKIVSPDISHKTDIGGVILGIKNREEVMNSYRKIITNVKTIYPAARIAGVLVQKMVPKGVEVIVGGTRDNVFGIVIMFGLGGVLTEVFRDVTFRVWPFTREEAMDMITEIKGVELLKGHRGLPPANINSIAEIMIKLGKLMEENPDIESADLNPVVAYPDKSLVVDARFILKQE